MRSSACFRSVMSTRTPEKLTGRPSPSRSDRPRETTHRSGRPDWTIRYSSEKVPPVAIDSPTAAATRSRSSGWMPLHIELERPARRVLGRDAEESGEVRVGLDPVAGDVPDPGGDRAGREGGIETGPGVPQFLLDPDPLRDVPGDAEEPGGPPVAVMDRGDRHFPPLRDPSRGRAGALEGGDLAADRPGEGLPGPAAGLLRPGLGPGCAGEAVEVHPAAADVVHGEVAALEVQDGQAIRAALDDPTVQLLALGQGSLGLPLLANTVENKDDAEDRAPIVLDRRGGVVDRVLGAVPGDQDGLIGQDDDGSGRQDPGDGVLDREAGRLVDDPEDLRQGAAGRLTDRPAGHLLGDGVEELDAAEAVRRDHRVADARQGQSKPLALAAEVRLGPAQEPAIPPDRQAEHDRGRDREEDHRGGLAVEARPRAEVRPQAEDDRRDDRDRQEASERRPARPLRDEDRHRPGLRALGQDAGAEQGEGDGGVDGQRGIRAIQGDRPLAEEIGQEREERDQHGPERQDLGRDRPAASADQDQGEAREDEGDRRPERHPPRREREPSTLLIAEKDLVDPEITAGEILGDRRQGCQHDQPGQDLAGRLPAPGPGQEERQGRQDEAGGGVGLHLDQADGERLQDFDVEGPPDQRRAADEGDGQGRQVRGPGRGRRSSCRDFHNGGLPSMGMGDVRLLGLERTTSSTR